MADGGCAGGSRPHYYLFSFFLFIDKNNESGGDVNSVVVGVSREREGEKRKGKKKNCPYMKEDQDRRLCIGRIKRFVFCFSSFFASVPVLTMRISGKHTSFL